MTRLILILTLLIHASVLASVIQLPDLVRTADVNWNIFVSSDDSDYQKLGNYALAAHGSFESVPEAQADFRVAIELALSDKVNLSIFSKNELIYNTVLESESKYLSFLMALDQAVEYIGRAQNLKGFYSGQLAYLGDRGGVTELYESDLFFRTIKPLTNDDSLALRPKWSPDGSHIVYTSYFQSGFPDLFLLELASRKRSTLAAFKGANVGGVFSPNGREVAMTLSVDGNSDLYRIRLDDRKLVRILKSTSLESSPSWSPEGDRIVFVSDRSGRPQLYMVNADGSALKYLKTPISKNSTEPDWNPLDKNKILFTGMIDGKFQIIEYAVKEAKCRIITNVLGGAVEPCWLSDGRHAVYTERIQSRTRLMLLDTVTKEATALHSMDFGNISGADFYK